jgi:hypothetical protein
LSSPDPLSGSRGNPQSLNHYSYVHNDPVNLIDPLGLASSPSPAISNIVCVEGIDDDVCWAFLDRTGGSASSVPLLFRSGQHGDGGGADASGPTVDIKVLDRCTTQLYEVMSLDFTLSQPAGNGPATNGSFSGANFNPLSPEPGLFFSVKNDANNGNFTGSTMGYVDPADPHATYTDPSLLQPLLAAIQITELGNALDLISGTETADQARARDRMPATIPNPLLHNNNSPPGVDLLNCLMALGGLKF